MRAARLSLGLCSLAVILAGAVPAAATTDTFAVASDAWVWSVVPANNIGHTGGIELGRTLPKSGQPVNRKRALLHFDIASIPAGRVITSAVLRLYVERTSADPLGLGLTVARLSSPFVEGDGTTGVTWDTQPGVEASPTDAATMNGPAGQWFEMDVTAVVAAEYASAHPGDAWLRIAPTDETTIEERDLAARSREYGGGTHAPQLVVSYEIPTPTFTPTPVPPPTSTVTTTPTPTATATATPTATDTPTPTVSATPTSGAPNLTIDSPQDGAFVAAYFSLPVTGLAPGADNVTVNGQPAELDGGAFSATLSLDEGFQGPLVITAEASNAFGSDSESITVTIDITAPSVIIGRPLDGAVVVDAAPLVTGLVTEANGIAELRVNGVPTAPTELFAVAAALELGPGFITVEAVDLAGNIGSDTVAVIRRDPPPDPATVASAIDRTGVEDFLDQTSFLFTGANPVQVLPDPAAIDPRRAAVLRGAVQTIGVGGALLPLPDVTVTVLGHPELGSTTTRADGRYDLAVNGGGDLTVVFDRAGYLSAQRQARVDWQDFASVDDVVLLAAAGTSTTIDLTAAPPSGFQVARQSAPSVDTDGTREATLFFPAGLAATLSHADGSLQLVDRLTVRAIEYTVGPHGPAAMPAPLPPTSAYTYAVELTALEAELSGATSITFDTPVRLYVDNFLEFDVGTVVPVGYYDRSQGRWVPAADGAVIAITSINTSDEAEIDLDGDTVPEDESALLAFGITAQERRQLAVEYPPSKTLWRVPVFHFSTYDCNWALAQDEPTATTTPTDTPTPTPTPEPDDPDCEEGSIIECQSQTLGERLPIVGTDLSMVYRSSRVPGRRASRAIDIPLIVGAVPPALDRVLLQIDVAGTTRFEVFPAAELVADQTFRFEWDGRDAYGRFVQGARRVTVRRAYQYGLPIYGGIAGVTTAPAFGRRRDYSTSVPQRAPAPIWQTIRSTFLAWDTSPLELGGWTVSPHHAYDPVARVLYRGDGSRKTQAALGLTISTAAGTGVTGDSGDGGPAVDAQIQQPPGLAVAADGTVYFGQHSNEITGNSVVRAINPDGTIRRAAGQGDYGASEGFYPDALAYLLASPDYVAVAPDGALYISDNQNGRVLRVRDPINSLYIEPIAGMAGEFGYSGDGGDALEARLGGPAGLAVAADGWVYVADHDHHVVRGIAPDGTIWTIAGTGSAGYSGDGDRATAATLRNPFGVALGPDGSVYIADTGNHAIRRVDRLGTMTTVAGLGTPGFGGDGGAAVNALLAAPIGIATARDGTLYIADAGNGVIRAVDTTGRISTVAGRVSATALGDGGAALQAQLRPSGVAVAPDGSVWVSEFNTNRIRRIERPMPGFAAGDIVVPADDRDEVYVFDAQGRHQETRHALTGAALFQFTYDPASRLLVAIVDGDGNTTTIQRDATGTPLAIVAADGQTTTLALDANGYLDRIENPAGEVVDLDHGSDGLLEQLTDARENVWTFDYDADGRLLRDDDPAGGYKTLARDASATGYEVAVRTGVTLVPLDERVTRYMVEPRADGGITRTTTRPDGTVRSIVETADGGRQVVEANGSLSTVARGPDPRFGLLAAAPTEAITTSGSLTNVSTTERSVTPPDPVSPFAFTQLDETTTVNGRPYVSSYDAATRTWTTTTPEDRQQFLTIDTQGRQIRSAVLGLYPLRWEYDARGRLSAIKRGPEPDAPATRVTSFTYKTTSDDQNGYLDRVVDPEGRVVEFDYDDGGRVIAQTFQPGTADQRVVAYGYDANGNLTALTPPGRPAHGFDHTAVNLEREYAPPLLAEIPDPQTTYDYNLARELTAILDPEGRSVAFDYAGGTGQLEAVTLQPAGEVRPYTYDPLTGQVLSVGTPDAVLSFGYDGALPETETWTLVDPPVSHTVTHGYDDDFRRASLQVDALPAITFGYDGDGLLTTAGALTLDRDDDTGLLRGTTLVGGVTITDTYTPSPFGEVDAYSAAVNGTTVYAYTIDQRDKLGRIVRKTETIQGVSTQYEYGYDPAGRLADVWRLSAPAAHLAHYDYDANGNRTGGFNQVSGAIEPASGLTDGTRYDDQDRLRQYVTDVDDEVTYDYTANGELERKIDGSGETTYTYDAFGNLRTVVLPGGSTIEYLVDGRNRRIGKRIDGNFVQGFLYQDQLEPVAELGPDGSVVAEFIYASKPHVPDFMIKYGANAGTYRIISDHLGSPRLVLDTLSGTVIQRLEYDEFGNVIHDSHPRFQPFGFAGGIWDENGAPAASPGAGLSHFGAREYDARSGRWLSKDPIRFKGKSALLYSYVSNDPINRLDPTGLACKPVGELTSTDYTTDLGPTMLSDTSGILSDDGMTCVCTDTDTPQGPSIVRHRIVYRQDYECDDGCVSSYSSTHADQFDEEVPAGGARVSTRQIRVDPIEARDCTAACRQTMPQ